MEPIIVEPEVAEKEGPCACKGASLAILKEVHKAYEDRLEVIDRVGGRNKLQMQVSVLRSWVGDLVGQNTLLARAVEDLEAEATARVVLERARHNETEAELRDEAVALRRRLARKDSDLRGLLEVLRRLREFDYCSLEGIHFFEVTESDIFGTVQWRQKNLGQGDKGDPEPKSNRIKANKYFKNRRENNRHPIDEILDSNEFLKTDNLEKEREIRRLMKETHQYKVTIDTLRSEISLSQYQTPDDSKDKKDAEVMVGMCLERKEGQVEAEKGHRLKVEMGVKSTEDVRTLHKENVVLYEELYALRHVCAALDEQCRVSKLRAEFKDEIIREMRRQLRQAKNKLKKLEECGSTKELSDESHKMRALSLSYGGQTGARLDGSGDDGGL